MTRTYTCRAPPRCICLPTSIRNDARCPVHGVAERRATSAVVHVDGCTVIKQPNTPDHWTVYRSAATRPFVLCRFADSWELHEMTLSKTKGALLQRCATRREVLKHVK